MPRAANDDPSDIQDATEVFYELKIPDSEQEKYEDERSKETNSQNNMLSKQNAKSVFYTPQCYYIKPSF